MGLTSRPVRHERPKIISGVRTRPTTFPDGHRACRAVPDELLVAFASGSTVTDEFRPAAVSYLYTLRPGGEDMRTSTVICPECHRPATVLDRFTTADPGGPVEYVRIRCSGLLSFLVPSADVDGCAQPMELLAAL
jgi:hypothetical protein